MFENIIGNNKIKEILEKSLETNKISHSYLFVGMQGIGKKLIAFEFAKALLCQEQDKYCGKCKSCIEFDTSNNPDFSYLEPEGNSIKIEKIRNMQQKIQEKPIISKRKIYIIDDADFMTKEAQNCLLKTLEEPPQFSTIILIGTNENTFLETIKSRCMVFRFQQIENEEIEKYLEQNYGIKNIDKTIINTFQGSIGKAILLKEKQKDYEDIKKIIDNLEKKDLIDILILAEPIYKAKEEIFEILDYINIILLEKAKKDYLYTKCINIVENTKKRLKQNANYDMCIDNMIFSMWEEIV